MPERVEFAVAWAFREVASARATGGDIKGAVAMPRTIEEA